MFSIVRSKSRRSFILGAMLPGLIGCARAGAGDPSAADLERPGDALKALAAQDPALGAKLELDPSVRGTWRTNPGRWDDPSRRIGIDLGPLALILYPSTILELPGALFGWILQPAESRKKAQLQRLAEEAAERAFPLDGRPPR